MTNTISESIINVETINGEMSVLLKEPNDDHKHPTIVIFHDAPGIRKSVHDFMLRLAGEGYRVVAPDLHHRHGRMIGYEPDEIDDAARAKISEMLNSMTDEQIQQDLDDTLIAVGVAADEKLGTIGFCLGARAVFRTFMRLPAQFVVGAAWHPSLLVDDADDSPHLTAARLVQPLYFGVGKDDDVQSVEMHQPFFDAVAPLSNVEVEIFDGAGHGFTWPSGPTYHDVAAKGSWSKTMALFAEHLDTPAH